MMSEHTPTPWTRDQYGQVNDQRGKAVVANGFSAVMSPGDWQDEARANAAFIVKAVNCHDELVAALKDCAAILPRYTLMGATPSEDEELGHVLERALEALSRAEQP